jgi:hypothetical protein
MTAPMPKGYVVFLFWATTRAKQRSLSGILVISVGRFTVKMILEFARNWRGNRMNTPLLLMVVILPWI